MKLTNNCYAILGLGLIPPWTVNSGFITGSEKTLIIDTGPNYLSAQTIYGYAKNVIPKNEIIVINTEKHLDHLGGNSLFKEKGIKIYGHDKIKRDSSDLEDDIKDLNKSILNKIRREAHEEKIFYENTTIVNPDFVIRDSENIDLGKDEFAEILFTPGHTPTNNSVYFPKEKILYCGDCLVNGYIPNLEAGNKKDWEIWLNSIDRISKL